MEETEGKLNELGQRISAIEKAQLQSLELIQGEPLTKDKIEELKKSREEQVLSIIPLRPDLILNFSFSILSKMDINLPSKVALKCYFACIAPYQKLVKQGCGCCPLRYRRRRKS